MRTACPKFSPRGTLPGARHRATATATAARRHLGPVHSPDLLLFRQLARPLPVGRCRHRYRCRYRSQSPKRVVPTRVTFLLSCFRVFKGLPPPLRELLHSEAFPRFTTSLAGARCQPAGGRKKRETTTVYICTVRKVEKERQALRTHGQSRCRRSLVSHWRTAGASPSAVMLRSLFERVGHEAVLDTCVAARIDAQTLADLAALPITFCADRRASWSIPGRCSSSISASCARTVGRCYLLAAY
jgi:hypothetical protein